MPLPRDINPGDPIYAAFLNDVKNAIFEQIVGDGQVDVQASGGRLVIRLSQRIPGPGQTRRVFRVTGYEQDGSNKRWVYSGKRLGQKTGAGYDGAWPDHAQDTQTYTLFSLNERNNGSSGTYGNGVNQTNLDNVNDSGGGTDGTFALQPIPVGTPVEAFLEVLPDGTREWHISNLPNGDDGACAVS